MRTLLVTGGAGFIGSHTIDLLLSQGYRVIAFDNLSSGQRAHLDLKHPHLELIEGDVLEFSVIEKLVARCDGVLHLAAIASVQQSILDPIHTLRVNTLGCLHLLEAISITKRNIRLVYASSAAVYGDATNLPCDDEKPLPAQQHPLSPYALQKRHCEDYAALYNRLYGIPSLGLRYFNAYGKRQDPTSPYSGVISRFLHAYQTQQPLSVFGEGLQSRDFVAVQDIARANSLALQSSVQGVMNIATGHPQTIRQLIECIEKSGTHPATVSFHPERTGDIFASYGTTKLAARELSFKTAIPLLEGIKALNDIAPHPNLG